MSFTPAMATFIRSCCSTSEIRNKSARVLVASGEILDECIACGGSVTGEHGIGVEKIEFMHKLFTPTIWKPCGTYARRSTLTAGSAPPKCCRPRGRVDWSRNIRRGARRCEKTLPRCACANPQSEFPKPQFSPMPVSTATETLRATETFEPADQAELAEVMHRAYASRTPIYPLGGGTSLDFGLAPKSPGWGLSLARLNRIVDYPARDMTITVEAGITMKRWPRSLPAKGSDCRSMRRMLFEQRSAASWLPTPVAHVVMVAGRFAIT